MTHFAIFDIFYNYESTKIKFGTLYLDILATKCTRNLPLHPSYVPTLPEHILTSQSYAVFL